MRILQIVTQMEGAGVQRVAYSIHRELLQRGYQSQLWFLYFKRPAYSGAGIEVLYDHKPRSVENVGLVMKLFARVMAYSPDVIIAHTYYANILGHLAGLLAGTTIRLAVQHNPIQTFPVIAGYVDRLLAEVGVYSAQIGVSKAVTDSMARYSARAKRHVHCIHNGIEHSRPYSHCSPCLRPLPARVAKILNVGRLSAQKNHDAMLETIARLPNTHLVLVGEGEMRSCIEQKVMNFGLAERVTFMGEVSPEEVHGIMKMCDVFLFPSLWEAMPMALLEAMAVGMPIVASDIPAHRELLEDTGVIVPAEPSRLAGAITHLLEAPVEAGQLAGRAAVRAKRFTIDAMVDGYERFFHSPHNLQARVRGFGSFVNAPADPGSVSTCHGGRPCR